MTDRRDHYCRHRSTGCASLDVLTHSRDVQPQAEERVRVVSMYSLEEIWVEC
jgi:hypothetical protein